MSDKVPPHKYNGARSLVILHESHMRQFLHTWREARLAGVTLPETDDPDYESMDTLLRHVLRAARGYIVWMCEMLELPDPGVDKTPPSKGIYGATDLYLDHLFEKWRSPLADVDEERFGIPEYPSHWNVRYCIDAMLEHAVMHPIRHRFQLLHLMGR